MFLRKPDEKKLKEMSMEEFEIQLMNLVRNNVQPESSKREDCNCPNRYLLDGTYAGKYCRCGTPNSMET